jgi:hypothetical protein
VLAAVKVVAKAAICEPSKPTSCGDGLTGTETMDTRDSTGTLVTGPPTASASMVVSKTAS